MKNGFYASTHPAYYNGKLKCNCGQLLDTFDSFYEHINNHNNLTWAYDLLPVQQFKRLLHDKIKVLTGQDLTKPQIETIIELALDTKQDLQAALYQIMVLMGIKGSLIALL